MELKVTASSGAVHPDAQPGEEKVVQEVLPFACTLVAIFRWVVELVSLVGL